jgi:cytochrome b6-f complex iron-sulfur subunit
MDRKDFIKSACAICALGLIQNVLESCVNDHLVVPTDQPFNPNLIGTSTSSGMNIPNNPKLTLDLNSHPMLNSSGGYTIGNNIIVANANNTLIAVSSICTHQGCTVMYASNEFQCPCHGSAFSDNGSVINGPATTPLQQYSTTIVGSNLYVF